VFVIDAVAPLPDATAVMAALSRAAHLVLDPAPHVFVDDVGLRLVNVPAVLRHAGFDVPDDPGGVRRDGWLFSPRALEWFRGWRGTFLARARFVEELVVERVGAGVDQLVVLGAGVDTLALRRADLRDRLRIFEVDHPVTQGWKQARIRQLFGSCPDNLTFAPVDFQATPSWRGELIDVGFDPARRSLVVSTGVTQYITDEALVATMHDVASMAAGTTFACTFMLPVESIPLPERELRATTEQRAAERGAPWISSYEPDAIVDMARAASFDSVHHVSAASWNDRWCTRRSDGLHAAAGEHAIVATR
jgi:methyltransferase (TIGR00027 family)